MEYYPIHNVFLSFFPISLTFSATSFFCCFESVVHSRTRIFLNRSSHWQRMTIKINRIVQGLSFSIVFFSSFAPNFVAIVLCQCHCQKDKEKASNNKLTGFCGDFFFNRYKNGCIIMFKSNLKQSDNSVPLRCKQQKHLKKIPDQNGDWYEVKVKEKKHFSNSFDVVSSSKCDRS